MCSIDGADQWAVYEEGTVKARKPWRCCECRRTIQSGEKYSHLRGILDTKDSGWESWRTCQHCQALGAWMYTVCHGYILGELIYELEEHFRDGYASIPFARLIAAAKQRWHDGRDPIPDAAAVSVMARELMEAMVHPTLRIAS